MDVIVIVIAVCNVSKINYGRFIILPLQVSYYCNKEMMNIMTCKCKLSIYYENNSELHVFILFIFF